MSSALGFISPLSKNRYVARRRELMTKLHKECRKDFTLLLWSGSEIPRNFDSHFMFRAHSDFLYLTGFAEPDCMLILESRGGKFLSLLALRPRDLSSHRGSEMWEGERLGVERAVKALGVDQAIDIHTLNDYVKKSLSKTSTLYWSFGQFSEWDSKLTHFLGQVDLAFRGLSPISEIRDPRKILHEMRKVKSPDEVTVMRKSAEIATAGHIRAMKVTRPGMYEYEVQSEVEREFKKHGAQSVAYNSIVGGGNNSCTLHYHANNTELKPTDVLLIDAGAELDGYASDITRTFPVGERFTDAQREVYSWVLKSQLAAVKAVKPGATFDTALQASAKTLSQGLASMGVFKTTAASVYKKGLWKHFMPHGIGHWLGLDVHDSGRYREDDEPNRLVKFAPGYVITIEPGLYFNESDKKAPKRFRGIGVRIEDDILVTRNGHDVLTKNCPKSIEAIENLRVTRL